MVEVCLVSGDFGILWDPVLVLYRFSTDHEDRGPVLLDDYPFASWASIGRVYAW